MGKAGVNGTTNPGLRVQPAEVFGAASSKTLLLLLSDRREVK